jgi:hypothetical protein
MLTSESKIEEGLINIKLSKKHIQSVTEVIRKELFLYKHLKLDPSNISLIIIGRKIEGLQVIKVFDKKTVCIEMLDNSYERFKGMSKIEAFNTDFILLVSFLDNGELLEITKCKVKDFSEVSCKKVKSVVYGVSDGEEVASIEIQQQDVKGTTCEVLKAAVKYSFNKLKDKKVDKIDCSIISYA